MPNLTVSNVIDTFLDADDLAAAQAALSLGDFLPLAGGTMADNATIGFDNSSAIREAGAQGLEIECSVGYRWQWVAGRMILRQINSGQISRILAIDDVTPGTTHDITEGFVPGTRWETVNGTIYTCTDATESAATWRREYSGNPSVSVWEYRAETGSLSGDPTAGKLIWNNAGQVSATSINVSHKDRSGTDIELILGFIQAGQQIFLQDRDSSANYQIWAVSGTPTVTGGGTANAYLTFPVTLVDSGGTGTTGFADNHQLLFGTLSSGGGVSTDDTRLVAFAADAGSTDAYAATLSPAPSAYTTGAHYRFKANTANTGAATINFNGLGAKNIVKAAGGVTTALADNDIRAGQWVDLVYDGTNMQMQSTLGNAGGGGLSAPTLAGINRVTSATGQTLTLATLDSNANINLTPHGTGNIVISNDSGQGITSPAARAKIYISDDRIGVIQDSVLTLLAYGFQKEWGFNAKLMPLTDNTYSLGRDGDLRWSKLFLGPTGLKIGNGTNGPTITASGTSPNENLNLNPSPAGTGAVTVGSPLRLKGYTVATLPAGTVGDNAYVTDAMAPVALAAVVGGGAVVVKVFYNGANWIVQ